VFDHLN